MGKAIVTFASVETLDAKAQRAIVKATNALNGLEPTNARIRTAVRAVQPLIASGMSVRALMYYTGVSKGVAERTASVARSLNGVDMSHVSDSADAIVGALFSIANYGASADVTRAAELAGKATTGDDAYAAVKAILDSVRAASVKALNTPAQRQPEPPAPEDETPAQDETPAIESTPREARAAIESASTLALIAELTRRTGQRGFTPDETLSTAFDALAAAWEEVVTTADALATAGA